MPEALSYICPYCGTEALVGKPCPGCPPRKVDQKVRKKRRAARKPWEQDKALDGLDLPDEDFDYDDFVKREFGRAPHRGTGLKWYWWVLAVVLLGVMGYAALVRW